MGGLGRVQGLGFNLKICLNSEARADWLGFEVCRSFNHLASMKSPNVAFDVRDEALVLYCLARNEGWNH